MKSRFLAHLSFAKLLILANVAFWLVFGVLFVVKSYPYEPHKPVFEEEFPALTYFGRALPVQQQYMGGLMRTTQFVQRPSFYAARPFFWYFNSHGIVVDHLYWGISVGGYYLLLVCLLSFLQWYLVGLSIDWVRRRLTGKLRRSAGTDAPA